MNILIGILVVILSTTLAICAIIGLYLFWFKAVPEFWKMITKN
jgi:hypothetical protein